MAYKGLHGHNEDEHLASVSSTIDDGASVHFISSLGGQSVAKICNIDSQGKPILKLKDINKCYGSVKIKSEGTNLLDNIDGKKCYFGGITIKPEMQSSETISSPIDSNGNDDLVGNSGGCFRKVVDMEIYDDCEEVSNSLTLSELRSQYKAKRQKIQSSSTSMGTNVNYMSPSNEFRNEGHHYSLSQPGEMQPDLDEPLILLKQRFSKKYSHQRNGKRNECPSSSNVITTRDLSFSSSSSEGSIHTATETIDEASANCKMIISCVEGKEHVIDQCFQNLNGVCVEKSKITTEMSSPKRLKDLHKFSNETGVPSPLVELLPCLDIYSGPSISESIEQSLLAGKNEVRIDDIHPNSNKDHKSSDIIALPTSDSITEFFLLAEPLSVETSACQQRKFPINDDFPCKFSMGFHSPSKFSDGTPEVIGDIEKGEKPSNYSQVTELKQPSKKLPSNRKFLSPTSREKLRQKIEAEKLCENIQFSSSRKKQLCDNITCNLPPLSGQRELKSMCNPERMLKKPRSNTHYPSCGRSSARSSFTSSDSQDAIKFSQRQMHDIEFVTGKLISWLRCTKDILSEVLSLEEILLSIDHKNKLLLATDDASVLEFTTEKYMAMMARDHKRFCKIMEHKVPSCSDSAPKKKAITFADEAGGLLCQVKLFEKTDTVL